jgi:hypothetical protein
MSVTQTGPMQASEGASSAGLTEALGGVVAVVLGILGLVHIAPTLLMTIATIVVGIALLAQTYMVGAEYVGHVSTSREPMVLAGLSGSWSVAFLSGIAGVVLGILALVGVMPEILVAAAVIAIGGGLLIGSGGTAQTAAFRLLTPASSERMRSLVFESTASLGVVQALVGLALIVLGILALTGFTSGSLLLIALLTSGAYFGVTSSAFGGVLLSVFPKQTAL